MKKPLVLSGRDIKISELCPKRRGIRIGIFWNLCVLRSKSWKKAKCRLKSSTLTTSCRGSTIQRSSRRIWSTRRRSTWALSLDSIENSVHSDREHVPPTVLISVLKKKLRVLHWFRHIWNFYRAELWFLLFNCVVHNKNFTFLVVSKLITLHVTSFLSASVKLNILWISNDWCAFR